MLAVVEMSLLQYLNQRKGELPNPNRPLAKAMPSSAIASANVAIKNAMSERSQGRKGIKYTTYSPRERAQIGKLGSIYGPTGAARYYKRKTGDHINDSTAHSFKKAYDAELKGKREREEDLAVTELHPKKRGRKL